MLPDRGCWPRCSLPLAVLALVGLVVRGTKRSVPSMVLALLGFVTAVAASHIAVSIVGETATPIWAAPGLSLYWVGLLGSATVAIEVLSRRAALPALVVAVAAILAAVPLLTAAAAGTTAVQESSGRILPAFVNAETANRPGLGTLELTAQSSGAIAVDVHRGPGTTLDERSTLATTSTVPSDGALLLADLAGNISSRSGFDIAATLDDLQLGFVLVPPTSADSADAIRQRIVEALDGNRLLDADRADLGRVPVAVRGARRRRGTQRTRAARNPGRPVDRGRLGRGVRSHAAAGHPDPAPPPGAVGEGDGRGQRDRGHDRRQLGRSHRRSPAGR